MLRRTFAASLAALAGGARIADAKPLLTIVATFSILADLVGQVAGDKAQVSALVGPDGNVHVYSPTPSDVVRIARAELIVFNGLGLDGWLSRIMSASASRAVCLLATKGLSPLHDPTGAALKLDPHCWHDVSQARRYVANIASSLKAIDAGNVALYDARASAYDARLAALDGWIRGEIDAVDPARRKVITGHDAFRYFGRAYGVEFHCAFGVDPESEPSARDIAAIISLARRERINALFIENLSNPTLIEQIAHDTGVAIGAKLYSDALSPANGPAPTYEAMMRHNTSALVAGMKRN